LRNVGPYMFELWCILCRSFVGPGDLDPLSSEWLSQLYLPLAVYDFLEKAWNVTVQYQLSFRDE